MSDDLPSKLVPRGPARFDAIPGSPWVYWVSEDARTLFTALPSLAESVKPWVGLQTSDNPRFIRFWWEIGVGSVGVGFLDAEEASVSGKRWFPHMKGGEYLKWFGNQDYVVNWAENGREMKAYGELLKTRIKSPPGNGPLRDFPYYFRRGITWTHTTARGLNVRIMPDGFICNVEGMAAYPGEAKLSDTLVLGY